MKLKTVALFTALLTTTLSYTNNISIQQAQQDNIPALLTLNEEVLNDYFAPALINGYPEYFSYNTPLLKEFHDGWNYMFDVILQEGIPQQNNCHILIASDDKDPDKIIGLCAFTKQNNSIYLQYLIVSQDSRNKGIGKMLLDTALSLYDDVTSCWLEALDKANEKTRMFYERYGFTTTGKTHSLLECAPNTHIHYTLDIKK